jgi:hypothetical protein
MGFGYIMQKHTKNGIVQFSCKVTLNESQGLYCLSYAPILKNGKEGKRGAFSSAHGFKVVERLVEGLAKWLHSEGQREALEALAQLSNAPSPSVAYYDYYKALCDVGGAYCERTGKRCPIELTPQLIGYEGKRVEVTYTDGTKERFKVGRSTGWMPCHLAIQGKDSGGPAVFSGIEKVVAL